MQDHQILIFTALLIFVFGLISRVSGRWTITGPMVFMIVGIAVSPLGFGLFEVHPTSDQVRLLAEITLILILFIDGSLIDFKALIRGRPRISMRLLMIGLPLTMLLGTLVGVAIFDAISFWSIALIAFILSPTDAALGQAVVKSKYVPDLIRQSISVESGINDGVALPPVLVCIAALGVDAGHGDQAWLRFMALQLTLGPAVGALVGWLGGRFVEHASQRGWMEPTFQRLSAASIAILAFSLAEMVHGNGFIATFCAGLALGTRIPEVRHRIQEFGEAEGTQLSLFVFLVFGLVMVPAALEYWHLSEVIYAVASLTVIRMIPVALCLMGTKLDWRSIAFIGWFGPRGIASVLYLLMVVGAIGLAGNERVLSVIVLTVMISVVVHGVSAVPLSKLYGITTTFRPS